MIKFDGNVTSVNILGIFSLNSVYEITTTKNDLKERSISCVLCLRIIYIYIYIISFHAMVS